MSLCPHSPARAQRASAQSEWDPSLCPPWASLGLLLCVPGGWVIAPAMSLTSLVALSPDPGAWRLSPRPPQCLLSEQASGPYASVCPRKGEGAPIPGPNPSPGPWMGHVQQLDPGGGCSCCWGPSCRLPQDQPASPGPKEKGRGRSLSWEGRGEAAPREKKVTFPRQPRVGQTGKDVRATYLGR